MLTAPMKPADDGHTHQLVVAIDINIERLTEADYYHALLDQIRDVADETLCQHLPKERLMLPFGPIEAALTRAARLKTDGSLQGLLGPTACRAFYRYRKEGEAPEEWIDRISIMVLGTPWTTFYGPELQAVA